MNHAPGGRRWLRRRVPPLAALLAVVALLLVFNMSYWTNLRTLRRTKESDMVERLRAVAVTAGVGLVQPAPLRVFDAVAGLSADEQSTYLEERFSGTDEHLALVARLTSIQRVNGLAQVAVATTAGATLADSLGRDQPGDPLTYLTIDTVQVDQALGGTPVGRMYEIDGTAFLRVYAAVRAGGRIQALVMVAASPEYQDELDFLQRRVGRQWLASSTLLVVLGFSLWRLFRYLVRVEETAMRAARIDAMGALAGAVAHELRNPLAIVRVLAEEVRADATPGTPADENAKAIVEETQRLNSILGHFLSLARAPGAPGGRGSSKETGGIESSDSTPAGTGGFRLTVTEASSEIRRVLDLLRKQDPAATGPAVGAEVAYIADLPPHPVPVAVDPEALRQVLLNLLLNARDAVAARASPRVEISVRERRGAVELKVRDNGPGFDRKTLGRAFEPFFTTKPTGTGLGLALVRGIVENFGGKIELGNAPGGGAEVTLTLPAAAMG